MVSQCFILTSQMVTRAVTMCPQWAGWEPRAPSAATGSCLGRAYTAFGSSRFFRVLQETCWETGEARGSCLGGLSSPSSLSVLVCKLRQVLEPSSANTKPSLSLFQWVSGWLQALEGWLQSFNTAIPGHVLRRQLVLWDP